MTANIAPSSATAAVSQPEDAAWMQTILNTVVDGIIVIDQDSSIHTFNPAAERIFGYSAAEVVGESVSMLMDDPDRQHHDEYVKRYVHTGEKHIIGMGREVQGRRADGTLFPLELAVSETRSGNRRFFIGIVRDISERKQLEQAIVDASEMERKQIGQDLHDTISQQLAGLTMLTQALHRKVAQAKQAETTDLIPDIERLADLTSTALTQVKNISHGLYPVELERNGLGIALQRFVEQQDALFGITCAYESNTTASRLPPPTSVHLYRIAQEALSNAIKHAAASRIQVRLEKVPEGIALTVTDNGKGLPTKFPVSAGLGLAIMRYRASMIQAKFIIQSRSKRGTKVSCVVPSPNDGDV